MRHPRLVAWGLGAALLCGAAHAQQDPIVRVEVTPEEVRVGESVELTVTVLVPTWFARPPVYPDFELANAITRLPPDSSYPTSERVGGESWSGIVRSYRVTPLAGATYRMRDERIAVTYANPGGDPVAVEIPVPEIVIRATVPAGAEGLDPYLAGRGLELGLEVEGEAEGLEAGDAIELRYTAALDGLPAIFLPPLAPEIALDGASIYRDQPVVADGPPARRSEKLTIVFEAGGRFAIPGRELAYWDTEAEELRSARVDGLMLEVKGPPAAGPGDGTGPGGRARRMALVASILLALAAFAWLGLPGLRARLQRVDRTRRESEAFAFRELRSALRSGTPDAAYHALLAWTDRLAPRMDARAFALRFGDTSLSALLASLSASLYADGGRIGRETRGGLEASFSAARSRYLESRRPAETASLPPLNP